MNFGFDMWYKVFSGVWIGLAITLLILATIMFMRNKKRWCIPCSIGVLMCIYILLPGIVPNTNIKLNILNLRVNIINEINNTAGYNTEFIEKNAYFRNMNTLQNKISKEYEDEENAKNKDYDYVSFSVKYKDISLLSAIKYLITGDLDIACRAREIYINSENTVELNIVGKVGENNKKYEADCYTVGDWYLAKETNKELKKYQGKYINVKLVFNNEIYIGENYLYMYKIKEVRELNESEVKEVETVSSSAVSGSAVDGIESLGLEDGE